MLGGVESVLAAHARLLRGAGYECRVVCGRGEGTVVPELDSRHPEVEALTEELAAGRPQPAAFDGLRERLRAGLGAALQGADLVIVHNVLTMPFNLPATSVLPDLGPRMLAWIHDLALSDPRHAAFRRPGPPYDLLARARPGVRYVAVSQSRREQAGTVLGLGPDRVPVVPNGIDVDAFLGLGPAARDLLARSGAAGADPLILVPVRVTPRKRIELALQALAAVLPSRPGAHLVVSGPLGAHAAGNAAYGGGLEAEARALGIEDRVHFMHRLGPPDRHPVDAEAIADLYRAADVVLLPSESEGFGLPLLESALARVPVVCARIPVLEEIAHGQAETFPAGGGAAAVALALERALAGPAAAFRSAVRGTYAWDRVLPRIEAAIEDALA